MKDVSITQKKNWMSRKGGMSKIMATVDVIPLCHSLIQKELLFRIPHHRWSFRQKW